MNKNTVKRRGEQTVGSNPEGEQNGGFTSKGEQNGRFTECKDTKQIQGITRGDIISNKGWFRSKLKQIGGFTDIKTRQTECNKNQSLMVCLCFQIEIR